jgi:hypothetical protein
VDGFTIAICNPAFLFGSLGFTLNIFGVWGAVILWGIKKPAELAETGEAQLRLGVDRGLHDRAGRVPADRRRRRAAPGTWTDFAIGVGVLVASVLCFPSSAASCRDKEHVHFREHTPATPEEEAALLGVEPTPPAALPA